MTKSGLIHPYMPNSVPAMQEAMLKELGVDTMEELYSGIIPDELRFKGTLNIPAPMVGEFELKEHVMGILNKNTSCEEYSNFLGAGCYQHYVPALCDEVNTRAEFLTAYCGDTYSDHGKMQAFFEYTSMLGELVDMDVVSYTSYEGGQAVSSSLRMALRMKPDKNVLLVPSTMNPEILSQLKDYCRHLAEIKQIAYDQKTGLMDLSDLEKQLAEGNVAGVFYENPSYLGFIETQGQAIADLAHKKDAICVAMPDVASLGVMESPANYGADIVCGDIQPLGMHIQFGGGCAGFIASRQEEAYIQQFPTYFYGLTTTQNPGEYGWGRALNYRCSHGSREKANEYFGTETGLWAITAAVYMATLGPQGMRELGETIIQRCNYASKVLSAIPGIKANVFGGANFQEFVVNFDESGKTVAEINKALLEYKIFGGKDLSGFFPELGQSALYCVTETTTAAEIDHLAEALKKIVGGR